MSLDQLKAFLARLQQEDALRQAVLAAATADDVAQIAAARGFEFSYPFRGWDGSQRTLALLNP
jgi:predicted ribosomally synthesized peptide with nif11-like leader